MNGAYGDWWSTVTSSYTLPAVAASAILAPIAAPFIAPVLAVAGAADAYNWYTAVPTSPTLQTGPAQTSPAPYDLQLQQQAQIDAAVERYKHDPAATGKPMSWFWPIVILGGGAVIYFSTTRRRGRS